MPLYCTDEGVCHFIRQVRGESRSALPQELAQLKKGQLRHLDPILYSRMGGHQEPHWQGTEIVEGVLPPQRRKTIFSSVHVVQYQQLLLPALGQELHHFPINLRLCFLPPGRVLPVISAEGIGDGTGDRLTHRTLKPNKVGISPVYLPPACKLNRQLSLSHTSKAPENYGLSALIQLLLYLAYQLLAA